jgi:hypothetical protein
LAYLLTTTDNPWNPVTDYDEWDSYDRNVLGYFTNAYLGRVARTSPSLSGLENELEVTRAMDEIVRLNGGLYLKVEIPDSEFNKESDTKKS